MALEDTIITGVIQGGIGGVVSFLLIKYALTRMDAIDNNIMDIKITLQKIVDYLKANDKGFFDDEVKTTYVTPTKA